MNYQCGWVPGAAFALPQSVLQPRICQLSACQQTVCQQQPVSQQPDCQQPAFQPQQPIFVGCGGALRPYTQSSAEGQLEGEASLPMASAEVATEPGSAGRLETMLTTYATTGAHSHEQKSGQCRKDWSDTEVRLTSFNFITLPADLVEICATA